MLEIFGNRIREVSLDRICSAAMKKPAAKRPARAVQKKPSKSPRTDWNWAGVVMGPCETSVIQGSVAICLKVPYNAFCL